MSTIKKVTKKKKKKNIVQYEHRLNDVRDRQGNYFCSGIIETITARTSSGTNGGLAVAVASECSFSYKTEVADTCYNMTLPEEALQN